MYALFKAFAGCPVINSDFSLIIESFTHCRLWPRKLENGKYFNCIVLDIRYFILKNRDRQDALQFSYRSIDAKRVRRVRQPQSNG